MFSSLKCSSAVSFSAVYQCQILSISENLSTDMHGRLLYPTQIIRLDVRNPQTCQIEMSLYKDRATFHTIIFTISRLLLPNKTANLWELSRTQFFIQHSTFADKRLLSLYGRTSVLRNYLFNFSPTSVGVFKRISVRRVPT